MEFLQDLHLADVLVLDDFLTTPIEAATAHQLLNILAEREHPVADPGPRPSVTRNSPGRYPLLTTALLNPWS